MLSALRKKKPASGAGYSVEGDDSPSRSSARAAAVGSSKEEEELRQKMTSMRRTEVGNITTLRGKQQNVTESLQDRTFTRWINYKLHAAAERSSLASGGVGEPSTSALGVQEWTDLRSGAQDAEMFAGLLEVLTGKRVLRGPKKTGPVSDFNNRANLEEVFTFLHNVEGLQLVGTGPQDILNGNMKLILGLVWVLILRYHLQPMLGVKDTKVNATKAMEEFLKWVRKTVVAFPVAVRDFRSSFSDGRVLCSLVEAFCPGTFDLKKIDTANGEQNCTMGT
eukprot:TRINITY_DN1271_c1_g1_i2.p1 TRINITY_DN1271_c1_g1~~TRINITY_DN1271_c1_g1_i2.p1  ORF type:complete len:279 (+),score=51.02 TRINITY_DN1271_c1_g1_i2:114-950(+)